MGEDSGWRPAVRIPEGRERWQRGFLVWGVGGWMLMLLGLRIFQVVGMEGPPAWFGWALAVSVGSAAVVLLLRAATVGAAGLGAAICVMMLMRLDAGVAWRRTALPELMLLFGLTFVATRFGSGRAAGVGERQDARGRTAAQIVANLGIAGLCAGSADHSMVVAAIAVLAEATADTVASEMGKALGGRTVLLTTWRRVAPGTDGGVSLAGTLLGVLGAGAVAGLAVALGAAAGVSGVVILTAGCGGLVFDSLLGATLERRGWIGNDLVNFAGTLFAAVVAFQVDRLVGPASAFW